MKISQTFKHKILTQFIYLSFSTVMVLLMSTTPLIGQSPSSVIPDLVNFKIQYPLDENGNDYTGVAWEDRDDPHIASLNESNLSGYIAQPPYDEYFYVSGGEVVFKAHCAGALTSVNAYPRCELRETPNGTNDLWNFSDEQELNATFRVTNLPEVKKEVCMLQIKGNNSNSTSNTSETFRLEYREGSQGLHLVKNETTTLTFIMGYTLGETITARLYINNGDVTVDLTNVNTGETYFHQYSSAYSWGYFKAGCYTQSSIWQEKNGVGDEDPTAYGEVRFSSLELGVTSTCIANIPDNPLATDIELNAATLKWGYDAAMDHYNVRYRPEGSSIWSYHTSLRLSEGDFTVSGSTVIFDLAELIEDTEYEWQVRAKCPDNSASAYNDGAGPNFTTLLALPVELVNFKGNFEKRNNQNSLTWQTSSEINNKGFHIERTLNPRDGFEVIGWLAGEGNSDLFNEYNFIDNRIKLGERYYYRLRQVDFDGGVEFSKVIVIQTTQSDESWTIFPNPAVDVITIGSMHLIKEIEGLIRIIDINGKIVLTKTSIFQKEEDVEFSIGHLSPGVYSVLVVDEKGQIIMTKSMVCK